LGLCWGLGGPFLRRSTTAEPMPSILNTAKKMDIATQAALQQARHAAFSPGEDARKLAAHATPEERQREESTSACSRLGVEAAISNPLPTARARNAAVRASGSLRAAGKGVSMYAGSARRGLMNAIGRRRIRVTLSNDDDGVQWLFRSDPTLS